MPVLFVDMYIYRRQRKPQSRGLRQQTNNPLTLNEYD